jgi:DNA primase
VGEILLGDWDLELRSVIREIKDATDIVDLISSYIPVHKAGKYYKALCPFHGEKTPSFFIYPDKKYFHCFGCGITGDAFKFVQEYEKISFIEALRSVALRCGLSVPEGLENENPQWVAYEKTFRVFALYYHQALLKKPIALDYLVRQRGFDISTIKKFQIGFCGEKYPVDSLREFLKQNGIQEHDEEKWNAWGLVNRDGSNRFYQRIVFPLQNRYGQYVGFSGRVLEGAADQTRLSQDKESAFDSPKYMNTPQTPFFNKSKMLYLEHVARKWIQDIGFAIIVEGFFDAIRLHINGIENAVAVMGTAFTTEHFRTVGKVTKQYLFIFDSDDAGNKAAERVFPSITPDARAMVCFLPGAKDPDEYLWKHSKEEFKKALLNAIPIEEHLIRVLENKFDLESIAGKDEYLKATLPIMKKVKEIGNLPSYEHLVRFVSEVSGIGYEKIENWYNQKFSVSSDSNAQPMQTKKSGDSKLPLSGSKRIADNYNFPEDFIFAVYLAHVPFRKQIEEFCMEYLSYFEESYRPFFTNVRKDFEPDEVINLLEELLPKTHLDRVFKIMKRPFFMKYEPEAIEKMLLDCFYRIRCRKRDEAIKDLELRLQECENPEERKNLLQKRLDLIRSSEKARVKN